MTKKYANLALIYALAAMAGGVFFREFTRILGYTGLTKLTLLHPHYFLLGMVFFLLLALLEKAFRFSDWKHTGKALALYQVGLNVTALGFLARGVMEVLGTQLSRGLNASISGVAGIGHVMLGVSMVLLLVQIKKKAE